MQEDNVAMGISSWLSHLHALYPPQEVVVVGGAGGTWPELLDILAIEHVLLIDDAKQKFTRWQGILARRAKWQTIERVLGPRVETTKYFLASNPSENGLVKPESLRGLWPNLRTCTVMETVTERLDSLLEIRDGGRGGKWLLIDNISALPILAGTENSLKCFEVVIVRTLLKKAGEMSEDLCKPQIDLWLENHGYRYVACVSERHPAIVKAIYLRDRSALDLLQSERDELLSERDELKRQIDEQHLLLERLTDEKLEIKKNVDACQEQLGELKNPPPVAPNPYAHNRTLTADLNGALCDFAKSTLGIEGIKPTYIDYIAGRSLHLEKACVGRLATTVQDVVARQLIAQCLKSKELNVLEIGALYGVNLAIIYNHVITRFDKVSLTCLDPFDGYYGQAFDPHLGIQVNDFTFTRNMAIGHVPESNYRVIKKYSTDPEALKIAEKLDVNLLIIDGDHSYAGVKFDFDAYFPLVTPGGYIIFDDYNAKEWPGVQKFVDEEIRNNPACEFLGAISRTAAIRKRLVL